MSGLPQCCRNTSWERHLQDDGGESIYACNSCGMRATFDKHPDIDTSGVPTRGNQQKESNHPTAPFDRSGDTSRRPGA